jgi:hypothetical protein
MRTSLGYANLSSGLREHLGGVPARGVGVPLPGVEDQAIGSSGLYSSMWRDEARATGSDSGIVLVERSVLGVVNDRPSGVT